MKKLYHCLFILFVFSGIKSQTYTYGNEWINYSQKYLKIKLYKDGIYKIDSTSLANALSSIGVQLNGLGGIDPRRFQVFIKGTEQYIHVQGELDGIFDGTDYIEFYGYKNDGSFDSSMYIFDAGVPPANCNIPNPYYSVVQDTLSAFLTWNSSVGNKRFLPDTDTLFSPWTAAPYFFNFSLTAFSSDYYEGALNSVGALDCRYVWTEGRCSPLICNYAITGGASYSINIPTPNAYAGGPAATLVTTHISRSRDPNLNITPGNDHHLLLEWKDNSATYNQVSDTLFYGYAQIKKTKSINPALIAPVTEIKATSIAEPSYTLGNEMSPTYSSIFYPQTFDLAGQSQYIMYLPQATAKTYSDFSNFTYTPGATVKAFDLTQGRMVYPVMTATAGKFLLSSLNPGAISKVVLTSSDNDIAVSSLLPVNGNGSFTNFLATNADSAFIIVTHTRFMSEATQYKNYRQTIAGGNFQVILADVEELYDQFAYGIEKHPKSIRNFSKLLIDSMNTKPKYLFLIGKSTYGYFGIYKPSYYKLNYVPSYGYPPSDNLLTAGLNQTFLEPLIPTGRISATTGQEVLDYLTKVQQHDVMPVEQWQKNVMHFIGGTVQSEQNTFSTYMSVYKTIIENPFFGGNVATFIKNTSAPIQTLLPDSIIDMVNAGVSLMTFYGHGSHQSFDFNINDPNEFSNTGKYPLVLSNSCYTGDIHTSDTLSLSERYVFAPQKGSIAFMGSVSLGVAQFLYYISQQIYQNLSYTNYGAGVGDVLKGAIINTQNYVSSSDSIESITCMEMTLHGDPSVKLSLWRKPDYAITPADLTFNTSLSVDSIQVNLKINNLAMAVNDSFTVSISRTFPNGSITTVVKKIKAPLYSTLLSFFIPVDFINGPGLNYFSAWVDPLNDVDELDNLINNRIFGIPLFIYGNDIVPVYPYEFAIVPVTPTIRLKASTSNPFASPKNYIFQLDTTDAFTNPIASTVINSVGGVVEWNVNLAVANPNPSLPDSTVYYWRVSGDSLDSLNNYNWRESSFQVIDTKYGWGQSHFYQYKKDNFHYVIYDKPNRLFSFVDNKNHINIHNGLYDCCNWGGSVDPLDLIFNWNSSPLHIASSAFNGWSMYVIDSITGDFDMNTTSDTLHYKFGTYHQFLGGFEPIPYYDFSFGSGNHLYQNVQQMQDSMLAFLNSIPKGKYLLGYSNNFWTGDTAGAPHTLHPYSTALYDTLINFGMPSNFPSYMDTVPVCFLGQKGIGAGMGHSMFGPLRTSVIDFKDSVITHWDAGTITSPLIGPSAAWHSIHWRYTSIETNSADTVVIYVLGIKNNGQVDTVLKLGENSLDTTNLDLVISASTYPFLKLLAKIDDNGLNTAPQMKRWQVLYDPAPEGAINPSSGYSLVSSSLQEGDSIRIKLPFKNISEFTFADSLIFTYWIEDNAHIPPVLIQKLKKNNLAPDSVIIDNVSIGTLGYPGATALWAFVNPKGNTKYQDEQFQFNNFVRIPFSVNPDIINPILDVTFDGVHILNTDLVSSKPKILVTLKDENLFLALNDTSDFEVYLTAPGAAAQRVYFGSNMTFDSAQLPNNSCKIEFNPLLPVDGIYTLRVKGQDRSSNASGSTEYKIQFEVVNKPSITHIMNYPNPFSTNTKFVFTLTGSEIPETFMIQIMTISGKVVREIKREELGFIHIGRNITEYSWDGKDDFGDIMGNGVYLYRVQTRLNGQTIDNRESGADPYFTKEIGKMVIIH
ncbi:MAG: hypothetical protein IAF38_20015 [Bacteroidia bacterium]|nr:hypothetical protein [Bacteroidia bacterium]